MIHGPYSYTTHEGGVWLPLQIPPIRMRMMHKICRARCNWGDRGCNAWSWPKDPVTLINVGFFRGNAFEPVVMAHSIRFPDGRIWDSSFRYFRPMDDRKLVPKRQSQNQHD
jgi:hypothetical protein